jgi:hypothetical protein
MSMLKKSAQVIGIFTLTLALLAGSLACAAPRVNLPVVLFSDFGSGDYRVS